MTNRKKLVILICLVILMKASIAQSTYPIHITITGFNGSCNNLDLNGKITKLAIESFVNAINSGDYEVYQGVNCNAFRNELISTMNDKKNGLGSYGCHMTFYVSPCPGATPNSGSGVSVNILGPDQGSSFYSPNTLNEILNWDKDDEYKQKTLSYGNKFPGETQYVKTDDDSFDEKRGNTRESDWYLDIDKPFRSLNVDETGGINTHSDDYKTLNVDSIVLNKVEFETKQPDDSLLRDWGYVAKDITSFLVSLYCQDKNIGTIGEIKTAALLEANINLYSELYKAKKAIDNGEKYDAPNNFITDAFVFWLGDEYKITGNVFYNTLSKSVKPFVDILVGAAADKIVERLGEDMADKYTKYNNMKTIFSIASDVVDKNLIERTYDHFKQ